MSSARRARGPPGPGAGESVCARGRPLPVALTAHRALRVTRWPAWIRSGDLNGSLGLALDNTTQLIILASLLVGAFGFPPDLVLYRMVPGTALGVFVGNLVYTFLAVRLMRRTGRIEVTAMPFGIDSSPRRWRPFSLASAGG